MKKLLVLCYEILYTIISALIYAENSAHHNFEKQKERGKQ